MSQNYQISYADLSGINSGISRLHQEINSVVAGVIDISQEQGHIKSQLEQLIEDFAEFVDNDRKQKALQLAETRVGVLSQQFQTKFGYYAEIRRMAVGILQGVDVGVLSDDTLRNTTEEVMMKAPGYWLAPVLVAIAAWIRNDQAVMQPALAEALRRDDYKATLFLVLVMRRLGRKEASLQWLKRYFLHQDPQNLDREFITLLEGIATGLFPPAAQQLMQDHVRDWLAQLTQSGGFVEKQETKWVEFMQATAPTGQGGGYPLLTQYATNWPALHQSLNLASAHAPLGQHFASITAGAHDFSGTLKVQLDQTLSRLVSNFDDEELPLQAQVHLNQLIVAHEGDKKAAQAQVDAEEGLFDEQVDLLQLLTNALFDAESAGTTRVTQALALSISQPWILSAHGTFTARTRQQIPAQADLVLGDWQGQSADGHNENQLVQQQEAHFAAVLAKELDKLATPTASFLLSGLLAAFGVWMWTLDYSLMTVLAVAAAGIWSFTAYRAWNKNKQSIRDNVADRELRAREVLRGCLAELVDYRGELSRRDAQAEPLREQLAAITPESFASKSYDTVRSIVG